MWLYISRLFLGIPIGEVKSVHLLQMWDGTQAEGIHLGVLSASAIVRSWEWLSFFMATDSCFTALTEAALGLMASSQQSGRAGQQPER